MGNEWIVRLIEILGVWGRAERKANDTPGMILFEIELLYGLWSTQDV
jgi:hypothetical protein